MVPPSCGYEEDLSGVGDSSSGLVSSFNKKLLACCSFPDPMVWQEDAFLNPGSNLNAYTFSPVSLIAGSSVTY